MAALKMRIQKLEGKCDHRVVLLVAQPREGETQEQAEDRVMHDKGIARESGTVYVVVNPWS